MKIKVSSSDFEKCCKDCSWYVEMLTPTDDFLDQLELLTGEREPVIIECGRPKEIGECKVPRITE